MASKKKAKSSKNKTTNAHSKNASQPQRVSAPPVKNGKSDKDKTKSNANPSKSPDQTNTGETSLLRKQKDVQGGSSTNKTDSGPQRSFLKISNFLSEVLSEFRKISWPQRSQVARETVSVLFLVLLITVLVWGFDLIVGKFIFSPLEHLGHLYGISARH